MLGIDSNRLCATMYRPNVGTIVPNETNRLLTEVKEEYVNKLQYYTIV